MRQNAAQGERAGGEVTGKGVGRHARCLRVFKFIP